MTSIYHWYKMVALIVLAHCLFADTLLIVGLSDKFLVDCGMFQGSLTDQMLNYDDFPFDITSIDFVILTHAHIDHSGRIPKLYTAGCKNPMYATKATCDLAGIMLPDSGHI